MFIHNWFPHKIIAANDSRISRLRRDIMAMQPQGLAGAFAAVRDADLRRTSKLIECPTLVIGGEHDTVTSVDLSKEIAKTIPGAQLKVFPAVHLTNIEFPERFNTLVKSFLAN